jgi:quinol monooxygenase YgiN
MTSQSMASRPLGAGYVVIAEFVVKPQCIGDFMALALDFSDECLESEAGCWQFDVVRLDTTAHGVLFFEAYDDLAAFDAHCRTPHLARFKTSFAPMIVGEQPLRRGTRGHTRSAITAAPNERGSR